MLFVIALPLCGFNNLVSSVTPNFLLLDPSLSKNFEMLAFNYPRAENSTSLKMMLL